MNGSKHLEINPDDYEDVDIEDSDNPELTDEEVARMRLLREVLPELYESLKDGVTVVTPAPARKVS